MSNTYKGKIGQQGADLDLAQIDVQTWFTQFPSEKVSDAESKLISDLIKEMRNQVVKANYTFSDPRFVMIAFNLFKRNYLMNKDYDFTITEFLILKQYYQNTLDDNESDALNMFLNSYIEFSLSETELGNEDKAYLKESAEAIATDKTLLGYCPLFFVEKIEEAINYSIEEINTNDLEEYTGEDIVSKDEEEDTLISEIEAEEEEEAIIDALSGEEDEEAEKTEGEPSDISEWRETIATLQELIDENDSPESNDEWQETIDTLKELLADSGFSFDYGGVTNRNVFAFRIPTWATSALINGDLSGLTYDEIEKLDEFVDNISKLYGNAHFMLGKDSDVVEFKRSNDIDGNIGGDVNTLYVKATLPRRMYNDGGMSDSDIRAEIERQEKKLSLASLPESAKDVIRKKIAKLEAQLSEDDEDDSMSEEQMRQEMLEQETEAYYKEQSKQDSEIYAEIERQEKKLLLASLPESAKQVIRKKIAILKGQLSTADEEPIEEAPKKKEKPQPKEKPIEKVIDKLEEIEEEEEEESPIQKALGKIKKVEEEPREPKKRGRKPKAKVEPTEPKIPQKRGRKPKPKVEVEPKVPQKRGRKPKPKLSLSDFGIGTKFNINDFI
jgi:hypothetical protein